jgi:hypothetical protein
MNAYSVCKFFSVNIAQTTCTFQLRHIVEKYDWGWGTPPSPHHSDSMCHYVVKSSSEGDASGWEGSAHACVLGPARQDLRRNTRSCEEVHPYGSETTRGVQLVCLFVRLFVRLFVCSFGCLFVCLVGWKEGRKEGRMFVMFCWHSFLSLCDSYQN